MAVKGIIKVFTVALPHGRSHAKAKDAFYACIKVASKYCTQIFFSLFTPKKSSFQKNRKRPFRVAVQNVGFDSSRCSLVLPLKFSIKYSCLSGYQHNEKAIAQLLFCNSPFDGASEGNQRQYEDGNPLHYHFAKRLHF